MQQRVIVGVIAIVIIAVMLVISIVIFGSKKIKSPIKLDEDLPGKNLFIDEKDMEYLIGKKGVAITDLKPAGKGEFDGVKLDIQSANYYIKKDSALVITEVKDNRIIVEEEK
jgi:membrane-bound ClpP family serine protease